MFERRVLKAAAIRVQSTLDCTDPEYPVCTRIADDISEVCVRDAKWKEGDPIDEAVAYIQEQIRQQLTTVQGGAEATVNSSPIVDSPVERPVRRRRRSKVSAGV